MKERILKALVQGISQADHAAQVCRWMKQLILAGPTDTGRWVYTPSEGELQGWLGGQPLAGVPGVEVCSRLAFRPLQCERVPSDRRGWMLTEWTIGLEVLPPVMLYRGTSLMQLLRQGIVPQKVVWQGEVLTLQSLGRQAVSCGQEAYAVLHEELMRRLELVIPPVLAVRESPLQQYQSIERQLRQLFAAGSLSSATESSVTEKCLSSEESVLSSPQSASSSTSVSSLLLPVTANKAVSCISSSERNLSAEEKVLSSSDSILSPSESILSAEESIAWEHECEVVSVKGCPLSLCLRLQEVPSRRLHRVDEALQMRCFGEEGEERCPEEGCRKYGLWSPSAYSSHRLVMLYPQGALQQARSLFDQLFQQSMLLPLWWQTDEAQWMPYIPGQEAYRQLEEVLRQAPWTAQLEEARVYALLVKDGAAAQSAAGTPLDVRLRRVARLVDDCLMEPVPLHAVERKELAESLKSQLLRLSVELGGLPWKLQPSAPHDAMPVVGLLTGDDGSGGRPVFAFSVWKAGKGRCSRETVGQLRRMVFQLGYALQECCAEDGSDACEAPCRQLLVCVRAGMPQNHLALLHQAVRPLLSQVSVVLAFCRLTSGQHALCMEPDAPQGVPAMGTCVSLLTGEHLLHCRAASGRGGLRRAAPLAVRFCRLTAAEGEETVLSNPIEPHDACLPLLLEQVCRSVWSNPSQLHGSGWPWVLQRARHLLHDFICDLRDGLRY